MVVVALDEESYLTPPFAGTPSVAWTGEIGRVLNVFNDPDDVVRRIPLSFVAGSTRTPSMAVELAARALGEAPQFGEGTGLTLAGYRVPGLVPNTMTLNFAGGAGDVPAYSFADLSACAASGNAAFFQRAFNDKIVVFGTLLDVEDRKVTSKRFATAPESARGARCVYPARPQEPGPASNTISGVYVHATAVSNLIRHGALTELNGVGAALGSRRPRPLSSTQVQRSGSRQLPRRFSIARWFCRLWNLQSRG